jgi:hypothetical protein
VVTDIAGFWKYQYFKYVVIFEKKVVDTPSLPPANIFILGGENTGRHQYYWFSEIPILIPSSLSNEFTNPSKIYERK